jgi:phosphoribosyl 1,2-cyclic phosphodiesterase
VRFACLGSGSEGNGLLVECGGTRVLIDCGFGIRDAVARLARLGVEAESVTAIIVTHEHSDHVGGVAAFAARYGTAVWLTDSTAMTVLRSTTSKCGRFRCRTMLASRSNSSVLTAGGGSAC